MDPEETPLKGATDDQNLLRSEAELVLIQARKEKDERTKDLGEPIKLTGKALALVIRDGNAWIAENTKVARKVDLETGKTLQLYHGHTAPVTSLAFCDREFGSGDSKILITGSWDKTIKLWNTETKALISSTDAHNDFVKFLFVLPSLNLLVSGSSDKIVRFWDLSTATKSQSLTSVGSISAHTRPVECLDGVITSPTTALLYTGDTMGLIKLWHLEKDTGSPPHWRATHKADLKHHRTRINEMLHGNDQLWTASADDTVQIVPSVESNPEKVLPPINHPTAVRAILPLSLSPLAEPYLITGAGDVIRAYDVGDPEAPELLGHVDAHWHDVTALRLWSRKTTSEEDGKTRVEPWIVSASLDGTLRKWRLSDLLKPPPPKPIVEAPPPPEDDGGFKMTEEEERELAELDD